jgi:hypothetical protein
MSIKDNAVWEVAKNSLGKCVYSRLESGVYHYTLGEKSNELLLSVFTSSPRIQLSDGKDADCY